MMMEVHGYTEEGNIDATIDGARVTIPDNMGNRHRKMVAEWEAAGNVIPPYQAPPPTLPDLAPYQFRAMLQLSGKQDALMTFVDGLPEPNRTIAQSKLEFSLAFRRDNDLVLAAQQALGLSSSELDTLWLQAASIL